jgi:tripartite-type tricarboxylate transporter receptor subunit TctC
MFMPPRSPASAAETAARAIESALREPDIRDAWEKASLIVQSSAPQKLREAIRSEYDEWGRLTKAFGFTPES